MTRSIAKVLGAAPALAILAACLAAHAEEAAPAPRKLESLSIRGVFRAPGGEGGSEAAEHRALLHLAPGRMAVLPEDPAIKGLLIRTAPDQGPGRDSAPGNGASASPAGIWELDPSTKTHKFHPVDWLAQKRREADDRRAKAREDLRKIPAGPERDRAARETGINPEGDAPLSILDIPSAARELAGLPCHRVVLRRAADPAIGRDAETVLELWVTDRLEGPADMLRIYRELGVFSAEEESLLDQVRGFPLGYRARLPLGPLDVAELSGETVELLPEAPAASAFELPEGWSAWTAPAPTCWVCGKAVTPAAAERFYFLFKGARYDLCSAECMGEFALDPDLFIQKRKQ